ncbi:MAG: hypothetical protein ACTSRG_22350 [Candidatus Helarchaeota archaeon]
MIIGIVVIIIPFLIYLIAGIGKIKNIENPDDFFIAYKRVGTTPFANSSIAYGFQVATVYPFIVWAATGSVILALANTLFWGLGIFLFSLVIPKLKNFIGTDKTLHGYIGLKYESNNLRVITSYLTILGISGVALAEIVWGSSILSVLIGGSKPAMYLVLFFMIFFVFLYIFKGGQISSIKTDQIQLLFSYLGVFIIISYSLYVLIINNIEFNSISSLVSLILIISLSIVLYYRKLIFFRINTPSIFYKKLTLLTNILISVFFIVVIILSVISLQNINFSEYKSIFKIGNYGILTLVAYSLMPLLFQFCDMTGWQRILSVQINNEQKNNVLKNIVKGLRIYSFESPFSWFSVIALGAFAALAFPSIVSSGDPFYNIPNLLVSSSKWYEQLFGYTFILSILSIMLSTVDSAITAIMFTFSYDSFPLSRKILDSKDISLISKNATKIITIGKVFSLLLILFLSLHIFIDYFNINGVNFIGMLFAFYTSQLSFAIPVIGSILFKSLPKKSFVISSIVLSAAFGIISGIYITIKGLDEFQWIPILLTLIISSIVYFIGFIYNKNQNNER